MACKCLLMLYFGSQCGLHQCDRECRATLKGMNLPAAVRNAESEKPSLPPTFPCTSVLLTVMVTSFRKGNEKSTCNDKAATRKDQMRWSLLKYKPGN